MPREFGAPEFQRAREPGGPATQASLRERNLATVVAVVLADAPLSRADVATRTGLTRSTVSRLVDDLVERGLVQEGPPGLGGAGHSTTAGPGRPGRPGVPLLPTTGRWLALGLEVNVGFAAARLVDLDGQVLADRVVRASHQGSPPEEVLGRVASWGADLFAHRGRSAQLAGVALALPGLVDPTRGVLLRAPNLGWSQVPAARIVSRVLARAARGEGVRVRVGNEADFAALHVARVAPGRASARHDFLYLSGEVGIGSALVRGGDLASGGHGWAGEIGHVCVDPRGERCACGARGCLETVAGLPHLLAAAGAADRDALRRAVADGDRRALRAVAEVGQALGIAASAALNLFDVSEVVLGGHLAALGEWLRPSMLDELGTRVLAAPFAPPQVSVVDLDESPASIGGAVAVLEDLLAEPARIPAPVVVPASPVRQDGRG